jgi:uncharacterized membrane protein
MNLAQLHLLLNHLPIIGTFITIAIFMIALAADHEHLKQTSLGLFTLLALFAIPAFLSGDAAREAVKEMPDVSMELIQTHQGAALMAFMFLEITGSVSLIGLWRYSRTSKNPWSARPARLNLIAVLVFSIVTAGLMAITGNTGGEIRHSEITSEQVTGSFAATIGNLGARVVPSIQYFVTEYSRWVWPILETLHFVGLILLLSTIGILNLRVLGFFKQLPLAPIHQFLPWGLAGFVINVITGFLFFMGMPGFYSPNLVFQLKMLSILLAGTNLVIFYCSGAFLSLEKLGPSEDAPAMAKFVAACSIFLWIAIIVLGRYIPFGEVY